MDSLPGPSRKRVRALDPDFEETVRRWYEEFDDDSFSDSDSDTEPIMSDHIAIVNKQRKIQRKKK